MATSNGQPSQHGDEDLNGSLYHVPDRDRGRMTTSPPRPMTGPTIFSDFFVSPAVLSPLACCWLPAIVGGLPVRVFIPQCISLPAG